MQTTPTPRMTQLPTSVVPSVKPKGPRTRISRAVERASLQSPSGPIKVRVQFRLSGVEAKSVSVAGTFNEWNSAKTPLKRDGADWIATLSLPRGLYEYRFVVDGQWISDPAAAGSAPNPFGTTNSILSV